MISRIITILAVFLLGLGTSQLVGPVFLRKVPPLPSKSAEITKEATASALNNSADKEIVSVRRVIDGDTIELSDGRRVRYIGIDTPEIVAPRKPVECFGKEAKAQNQALVESKEVRLEKDISETDKYGRLLRYVFVGDVFVNDYLVRQGLAHASTFPPDIKYSEQFRQAEQEARENGRGLWSGCPS